MTAIVSPAEYVAAALWCADAGATAHASTNPHADIRALALNRPCYFGSIIFTVFSVADVVGSGVLPAGYLFTLRTNAMTSAY